MVKVWCMRVMRTSYFEVKKITLKKKLSLTNDKNSIIIKREQLIK